MQPLFIGSHAAMDFLNTTLSPGGERIELIGDGASFLAWLEAAGLLEDSALTKRRLGAEALDAAAREARRLRDWAADWISRWQAKPRGDYGAEVRRLNGLLERGSAYREVVAAKKGFDVRNRWRVESADDLVALLAAQIASFIAEEEPALAKRCAGPGCTLWFLDRTKAHRRLFCSAAACGNRAKVAAFRERQRSA